MESLLASNGTGVRCSPVSPEQRKPRGESLRVRSTGWNGATPRR